MILGYDQALVYSTDLPSDRLPVGDVACRCGSATLLGSATSRVSSRRGGAGKAGSCRHTFPKKPDAFGTLPPWPQLLPRGTNGQSHRYPRIGDGNAVYRFPSQFYDWRSSVALPPPHLLISSLWPWIHGRRFLMAT